MWASMVPTSDTSGGTSVMIWFIRTECAGGAPFPANSARILRASSLHSSLRNLYFGTLLSLLTLVGTGAPSRSGACSARSRHRGRGAQRPLDSAGDGVVGRQRAHHRASDELGEIVDGPVDATGAMEVTVIADGTDDTEGQEGGVLFADQARVDAFEQQRAHVGRVDIGAPAQDVDELLLDVLDLEQGEERGVLGHELHRRLGGLPDAGEGVGRRIHRVGLLAAKAQPDVLGQLAEQGLFVLEVPVEEALGDASGADDVDDACLGVPALREKDGRAVEQLLLALLPLWRKPPLRVHRGQREPWLDPRVNLIGSFAILRRCPPAAAPSASSTVSGTRNGRTRRCASRCRSASTATPASVIARRSSAPSSITAST